MCVADAEAKKVILIKMKSEILTQLRELIFQCDLTLKAVSVCPADYLSLSVSVTLIVFVCWISLNV